MTHREQDIAKIVNKLRERGISRLDVNSAIDREQHLVLCMHLERLGFTHAVDGVLLGGQ